MLTVMQNAWGGVKRLASDEQGAEGLEKLMIFAAIVIPLLGVLIFFRKDIISFLEGEWGQVTTDVEDQYDSTDPLGGGDGGTFP